VTLTDVNIVLIYCQLSAKKGRNRIFS